MKLTLLRWIPWISTIEGKLFHLFETGGSLLAFTVELIHDLLRPPTSPPKFAGTRMNSGQRLFH